MAMEGRHYLVTLCTVNNTADRAVEIKDYSLIRLIIKKFFNN